MSLGSKIPVSLVDFVISIPFYLYNLRFFAFLSYLQAEWDVRRSEQDGPMFFNKDTIRGFSPRVPGQSNLVDCGIFLLHYVEMFFKVCGLFYKLNNIFLSP